MDKTKRRGGARVKERVNRGLQGKRVRVGVEDSYTLGAYSCRVPNTFFLYAAPVTCTYVGRSACIEIACTGVNRTFPA